ncbi:MAG: TetR/AcrR family transcriptional regulator [Saccharospirillum sp.]|nr:TetR/AcrR family transcriptional regulator [Saccharospirillum sp.]
MAGTAEQIMDIAEGLIRSRGYQGFAFREIASTVGIKSASVHYHFPTKGDLAQAVMDRHVAQFDTALAEIDQQGGSADKKLKAYIGLYRREIGKQKELPVCMMLSTDSEVLPEDVVKALQAYYKLNVKWLTDLVSSKHSKMDAKTAKRKASLIHAALNGAVLGVRSVNSKQYFEQVADEVLALL